MTNEDQTNVETLAAVFEAFNRHDADGVMKHMTDDVVFDGAGGPEVYGVRFNGQQEVGDAFRGVFATFSDVEWADCVHFASGDRGISEWVFKGTKEDGSRVEAEGVDLFTFRDGKIASKRAFRKDRPLLNTK